LAPFLQILVGEFLVFKLELELCFALWKRLGLLMMMLLNKYNMKKVEA